MPALAKSDPDKASKKRKLEEETPQKSSTSTPSLASTTAGSDFPRGVPAGGASRAVSLHPKVSAEEKSSSSDRKVKKFKKSSDKSSKGKSPQNDSSNSIKSDVARVEHLNFKRLDAQTLLLGQITAINSLDVVISLPGQLLGYIPITNISSALTSRLEKAANSSSGEEDEDSENEDIEDDDKDDTPSLNELFTIGEIFPVSVINTKTLAELRQTRESLRSIHDEDSRTSRKIELTMDPEVVNSKLSQKDLSVGTTISGSVKSVEDNGYIINLGIAGCDAFASFSSSKSDPRFEIGQVKVCTIQSVAKNGRTCTVSLDYSAESTPLETLPTIDTLLPGTTVNCFITAISKQGLNVKFAGVFDGTIEYFHLTEAPSLYQVGQKLVAKILWITPDKIASPKIFSLTILPHLMSPDPAGMRAKKAHYSSGLLVENVEVIKVEPDWGLFCSLSYGERAFTHISRVSDERIDHLPTASGPHKPGTKHKARIVGYSPIDDLLQLSMEQKIMQTRYYRSSDVTVGDVVKVRIKDLNSSGLFVELSETLDAVIRPLHFSDVVLKHPEKKFTVGSQIKARVLAIDAEKNRVHLTARKSLINSQLVLVPSKDQVKPGMRIDAVVTKILPKALIIGSFGFIKALVSIKDVSHEFIKDLNERFKVGQPVKVKITKVSHQEGKIFQVTASIKAFAEEQDEKDEKHQAENKVQDKSKKNVSDPEELFNLPIGCDVSGHITALHAQNAVMKLDSRNNVVGLISLRILAKIKNTTEEELKSSLKLGDELSNLVVMKRELDKGIAILGSHATHAAAQSAADKTEELSHASPSKTSNRSEESDMPRKYLSGAISSDNFEVGQSVTVKITSYPNKGGVEVAINNHVTGKALPVEINDNYDDKLPKIGSQQPAKILKVNTAQNSVEVSLRKSRLNERSKIKVADPVINSFKNLKVGQTVRGYITNISDAGVFLILGRNVSARVQIKNLFDTYVKEWKPHFKKGQVCGGTVISIDKKTGHVEMSFKKESTSEESKLTFADLEEGLVVKGIVKGTERYGVFIRIAGTKMSGLCHKSQIENSGDGEEWKEQFKEGDEIKAAIIKVDQDNHKVTFSLKKELLNSDDEDDSSDDGVNVYSDVDIEEDGIENDDESVASIDEEDMDVDEEKSKLSGKGKSIRKGSKSSLDAGAFKWDGDDSDEASEEGEEDNVDNEENLVDDDSNVAKEVSDETNEENPATFEEKIRKKPNVASGWTSYMSYHLRMFEVEKARSIASRALDTMDFREEKEKMLVWLAILDLENKYGTAETLDKAFKDAVQRNEPKPLQLHFIEILEKAGNIEKAEEIIQRTLKKHSQSCKVWVQCAQYYMRQQKHTEGRALLQRSLLSLPSKKHVKTTFRFALMEYSLGNPERGRTIFEGILDSYPKRLDIWNVYIDKEVQQKHIEFSRTLFERVLSQNLNAFKTKNLLKKWLAIEKEHGDDRSVEAVKARAVAYVNQISTQ